MKKILIASISFLFSQQFNLAAMHHVKSGYKGDIHALASGNIVQKLGHMVKDEADYAASTIQEWLTPELINELVAPGTIQLNTKVLDELSLGQRTLLTCWATYPCYISLVYAHLKVNFEFYYDHDGSSSRERRQKKFTDALIMYNFGETFFEKIKQFSIREDLGVWKLHQIVVKLYPYLMSLFYKKQTSCIHSPEFEFTLECYNDEIREYFPDLGEIDWYNIIFLLENPYFFMIHIITWSGTPEALDIITLLIVYGFDVNCQLRTGCDHRDTLLHRAVRYDYVKQVEYLLELGADPLICYGKDPEPRNGGGQSSWEISKYKMQGVTWIVPNRPPSEKTCIIHAMLSAVVDPSVAHDKKECQQPARRIIDNCKKAGVYLCNQFAKAKEKCLSVMKII